MNTTTTTIEGDLPTGIVSLDEAQILVEDETLEETIDHAIHNGYNLASVDEHDFYGIQYTLEKVEVAE